MEIRVLRILEYVGDAESIAKSMEKNAVNGFHAANGYSIREAIVGNTLEILTKEK